MATGLRGAVADSGSQNESGERPIPRSKITFLLLICIAAAQTFTAIRPSWLPVYLHAPLTPLRPLLMVGMATALLVLLLRRGENLPRGECLALLIGTAGRLANLIDLLRFGAVADFVPLAPGALASPGNFQIAGGILGSRPLSLRHARHGRGLYGLYRHWRDEARRGILKRVMS